jgi:class 3 adenylate cyclase/CHASE2 domain-containing sensor protein
MLKKSIFLLMIGLTTFGLIHLISTETRLFLGMERALLHGYFFLREYDIREKNPLVSDEVMITGFDEDAIGVIGKWPWRRHVHARFLENIERFSPRAVMFDVIFVKAEAPPPYIDNKFWSEPALRLKIKAAFEEMDGLFAAALKKYNNVYVDLQLVEQARTNLPEFYKRRIQFNETIIKGYSQPVDGNASPLRFYSLEPILPDFIKHAHPVAVNVLPDDDGITRSFPLFYTYHMSDGSSRNLFSAVLALAQHYFRVGKDDIRIRPTEVVLTSAKVPVLDSTTHRPIISREEVQPLLSRIQNPIAPKGYPYNKDLFHFLVNEILLNLRTQEKVPLFPLHLLRIGDDHFRILDGWEILDAARRAGSKELQVIFYTLTEIHIKTPTTGVMDINYAGREKRYLLDPDTEMPISMTTVPTISYTDAYETVGVPSIPELDSSGDVKKGYDIRVLEKWYYEYCEKKAFEIYRQAQRDLGDEALDDDQLREYMNRYPDEGKYFFYYNFFVGMGAGPGSLSELAPMYADFGREMNQKDTYFFTEKEIVRSLMDRYRNQFQKYYNKFIFAGATAMGLGDIQQTPYGTMNGITTVVNAFNTIVTQNFLTMSRDIPGGDLILLLIISILSPFVYGLPSRIRISSFFFVLLLMTLLVTGFLLFDTRNLYIGIIPLLMASTVIFVSTILYRVVTEQKDKRFLKATFSSYLAPEIIDQMYATKTMPTLGGETRSITAYFTDIQGFSSFSEKLTAFQLVELINEYLTAMTNILIDEGGTLDKYEGDAIISFFGAPMALPDHPLRACRSALAMQKRLGELREKWATEKQGPSEPDRNTKNIPSKEWRHGDKWPRILGGMRMRIGINTGEIVVGNMGSSMRMNYTMMGDPVNLAARLESAGKQYGVYILVSEHTLETEMPDEFGRITKVKNLVETRFIDTIAVVGKSEPVRVYELCGLRGDLNERQKKLHELFGKGMTHYVKMEWDTAIAFFREALPLEPAADAETSPSQVYIQRCQAFKETPPLPDPGKPWDGVYRLTRK